MLAVDQQVTVKVLTVEGDQRLSLQRHFHRDEQWTVLDRDLRVTTNMRSYLPELGERVWIPRGSIHRIENISAEPRQFLEISFGDFDEADIERLDDDYARVPAQRVSTSGDAYPQSSPARVDSAPSTSTRPWGRFTVLAVNDRVTVELLTLRPGHAFPLHDEEDRPQLWMALDADGVLDGDPKGRVLPRHTPARIDGRAVGSLRNRSGERARFVRVIFPHGPDSLSAGPGAASLLRELDGRVPWRAAPWQPPVIEREPRRDWSVGRVLTGHRLTVVALMCMSVLGLYALQDLLWGNTDDPQTLLERIWHWGKYLWLGALVPGALGLVGSLMFRHSDRLDAVEPIQTLVCFRIVSRGDNVDALSATIRRCQAEMARSPLFPYVIEVVVDKRSPRLPAPNDHLRYLVVPPDYRTPSGSLFKARALQYAVEHSPLRDEDWIVHLDEETRPTSSGIKGIAAMIAEEERSGRLRIGQGAILYHRDWKEHPFLTLADNVRTGDDFARFHFQHRLGVTIFGLHGSFIVTRNDVEKSVGFDFGPLGSITEDSFWALKAMDQGHRCRWVDGYLEEQSTQSLADFVKQRRRWFLGLTMVSLHAPVKLRWRMCLGANTLLWAVAPFAAIYTVAHLFYGFATDPVLRLLANISLSAFFTLYLIGLLANMREHGIRRPVEKARWFVTQVVLFPAFNALECAGVLMAFIRPSFGFHVVRK